MEISTQDDNAAMAVYMEPSPPILPQLYTLVSPRDVCAIRAELHMTDCGGEGCSWILS